MKHVRLNKKRKNTLDMTQKKRQCIAFTEKFKKQIVHLVLTGRPLGVIIREYNLTPSSLRNWAKQ